MNMKHMSAFSFLSRVPGETVACDTTKPWQLTIHLSYVYCLGGYFY